MWGHVLDGKTSTRAPGMSNNSKNRTLSTFTLVSTSHFLACHGKSYHEVSLSLSHHKQGKRLFLPFSDVILSKVHSTVKMFVLSTFLEASTELQRLIQVQVCLKKKADSILSQRNVTPISAQHQPVGTTQ